MNDHHAPALRFRLSPDEAVELADSALVRRRMKGRPVRERVGATYFDTPRRALHKAHVELRLESTGDEVRQAVRADVPLGDAPGRGAREWVSEIDGDRPSLSSVKDEAFPRDLRRHYWDEHVRPMFASEVDRTTIEMAEADTVVALEIDIGHLKANGNGPVRFEELCDVELRLVEGESTRLYDVALQLIENHDLVLSRQTRRARGIALAKPNLRRKKKKAKTIDLTAEMSIGEAFLASARSVLGHLAANEALTLAGKPGGIHQSRVAIRRQRAVLRAFKKALPYDGRKAFNYEFRWFQKKMGPARDWHVFLDETLPFMLADGIEEDSLQKLRQIGLAERRRTSRIAAEYLTSRRFARLILHFERWLEALTDQDPLGKLDRSLPPFAAKVLDKTHRDLIQIDSRALVHMSGDELHALRIRGKKARYAGEFFHALYPREIAGPQLKLLETFQDRLGEANDASTARQIFSTIKPSRVPAEAITLLNDWTGDRIHTCALAAQPHWRELQRLDPFWRH